MEEIDILRACPAPDDDAIDFGMFCRSLGPNKPTKGDSSAWRQLFMQIEKLETESLLTTEREGRNIISIQLTDAGRDRIREWKENRASRRNSL